MSSSIGRTENACSLVTSMTFCVCNQLHLFQETPGLQVPPLRAFCHIYEPLVAVLVRTCSLSGCGRSSLWQLGRWSS
jgi:hypothetical protein